MAPFSMLTSRGLQGHVFTTLAAELPALQKLHLEALWTFPVRNLATSAGPYMIAVRKSLAHAIVTAEIAGDRAPSFSVHELGRDFFPVQDSKAGRYRFEMKPMLWGERDLEHASREREKMFAGNS